MKKLLIVAGIAVVLLLAAGGIVMMMFMGSAYEPGMVRRGEGIDGPLAPPPNAHVAGGTAWQVTPEVRIHHFEAGDGSPVLVLHGGPGYPHVGTWQALDLLRAERQFVYYHQRGCGQSTRPIDRFESDDFFANSSALIAALGIGTQIADIERIRRILGQEQITLLGHSFGAFTAALYAGEFPERVKSLVLVAPAPLVVFPGPDDHNLYGRVRELLPVDKRGEFDAYSEELFDFGRTFEKSEAELVSFNQRFVGYYQLAMANRAGGAGTVERGVPEGIGGWVQPGIFFSLGMRHDYSAGLRAVKAPVLILHGSDDLQPESASRVYLEYFPHARFVTIEGGSHFLCNERAEACAEAIREHLESAG